MIFEIEYLMKDDLWEWVYNNGWYLRMSIQ